MSYEDLDRYVDSGAPRWLKKTRAEIWRLLAVKDWAESSQVIKFYYYKSPFDEDVTKDVQKQIIAFTDFGAIIVATAMFDNNRRIQNVELQMLTTKDIRKLVLNASGDDPDYAVTLEMFMKDGSCIRLDSEDANTYWKRAYAERIREIARHLLCTI